MNFSLGHTTHGHDDDDDDDNDDDDDDDDDNDDDDDASVLGRHCSEALGLSQA
jgi:hypothetical protein